MTRPGDVLLAYDTIYKSLPAGKFLGGITDDAALTLIAFRLAELHDCDLEAPGVAPVYEHALETCKRMAYGGGS